MEVEVDLDRLAELEHHDAERSAVGGSRSSRPGRQRQQPVDARLPSSTARQLETRSTLP
jgi:hypothetical protein